ncbi:MAG TPA: NFACT RNA binding domain-containing protein [Patescibacteria group bacterium]|nr:NFACT RNA binding domain-containing protein [Patescibacteria group bacterium]
MPFDGSVINSIIDELNQKLQNGRVDKIYQPEKDELILGIRGFKENYKLLISASSNYPRIHLTMENKSNPQVPPTFCMLLRKHLLGGRLVSIHQPEFERIVEITIECQDEMGYSTTKVLTVEIMGRHSNIIFLDKESGKIIDSIKRVSFDISSVREVLPGRQYFYPPSGGEGELPKLNPLTASFESLQKSIESQSESLKADKFLMKAFNGISPVAAKEICTYSDIEFDADITRISDEQRLSLYKGLAAFVLRLNQKQYKPNIVLDQGKLKDFYCIDLKMYAHLQKEYIESISEAVERFYFEKDNKDRIKQKYGDIQKIITNRLDRCYKKLSILDEELGKAHDAEKYKLYGDLIMSNLYQITKDQSKINVLNYFSENPDYIEISMDTQLTPISNAQRYFKKYNKSKSALTSIEQQLKENKLEIEYLETQADNLEKCTEELEINEIRQELAEQGYTKKKKVGKGKSKAAAPSKPMHFISSTGLEIYVGKNNIQNDYLTIKFAGPNDIWLHTKEIPGSHVIVQTAGKQIDDTTLEEAANLAAFYSKAKNSTKVPVDYTIRKNVRKPNGSKPGMVIYENNKTVYIDPNEEAIKKLKKVN